MVLAEGQRQRDRRPRNRVPRTWIANEFTKESRARGTQPTEPSSKQRVQGDRPVKKGCGRVVKMAKLAKLGIGLQMKVSPLWPSAVLCCVVLCWVGLGWAGLLGRWLVSCRVVLRSPWLCCVVGGQWARLSEKSGNGLGLAGRHGARNPSYMRGWLRTMRVSTLLTQTPPQELHARRGSRGRIHSCMAPAQSVAVGTLKSCR